MPVKSAHSSLSNTKDVNFIKSMQWIITKLGPVTVMVMVMAMVDNFDTIIIHANNNIDLLIYESLLFEWLFMPAFYFLSICFFSPLYILVCTFKQFSH